MTLTISAVGSSHLEQRTKRLATLWRIERADGLVLTFTNHDEVITFDAALNNTGGLNAPDVREYTPVGGFDGTAKRRELGVRPQNLSYRGIVSSDAITVDDLRAGRYRNAEVREFVIDWKHPFMGSILYNVYVIQDTTFNDDVWSAAMEGTAHKFAAKTGALYSKYCDFEVFEVGGVRNCRKDPEGYNREDVVVAAISQARLKFRATAESLVFDSGMSVDEDGFTVPHIDHPFFPLSDQPQGPLGWFGGGKVTWKTGLNAGTVSEVRSFISSTREFLLFLPTPFEIGSSDTFDAQAGCDKLKQTCIDKFNNLINIGSFGFIVGPKEAIRTIGVK